MNVPVFTESRTKRLRLGLNWSQRRMGEYLGLAQSGVVRLEHGQRERGAIAKLLDQLEARIAAGTVDGESSDSEVQAGAATE